MEEDQNSAQVRPINQQEESQLPYESQERMV